MKVIVSNEIAPFFNLENICYFPSCSDEVISLHQFFTSRSTFGNPRRGEGGHPYEKQGMFVGEICISLLRETDVDRCLSFIRHLKDTTKTEYVRLLATVQERIPCTLVDPTRVPERSAEITPENRN